MSTSKSPSSRAPPSSSFNSFPILAIAVVGILTTAFLLVFYYVFVIKCCFNRRRLSFIWRFSGSLSRRRQDPFIIYTPRIENLGLDDSVIRSIPIFKFKKPEEVAVADQEKSINECAVCLNEFQEDEILRLLPNCTHAFHIDCIDIWLQSNANCPLCRSIISRDQVMAQRPYFDTQQMSISSNGDLVFELGSVSSSEQSSRAQEASVQAVAAANQQPSPKKLEQRGVHKKPRRLNHACSMGDECIDVRGKDEQFSIQPIRRSFSMDSSADRQLYLSVQEILQQNPGLGEIGNGESSSSRVKRSIFSFGHSRRGSRSAILPI